MIIEFIGIPASGKTTIATALVSELTNKGHKVELQFPIDTHLVNRLFRLATKLWMCLSVVFKNFEYARKLSKIIAASENVGISRKLNLTINGLYVGWLSSRAAECDAITVFHQGYLQFIYSVGRASDDHKFDDIIDTMLPWNADTNLVILAEAAPNIVETRLASRSARERNRQGHIGSNAEIMLSEQLMQTLTQHLSHQSVPWITFRSDDIPNVHPNVSELVTLIENKYLNKSKID
jgi:broad-specificity NMP kinase